MVFINSNIDALLISLEPAKKLILNDNHMYIVELNKNKNFKKWLNDNGVNLKVKKLHTELNLKNYENVQKIGDDLSSCITLGIIRNDAKKNVKYMCCTVDVTTTATNVFGIAPDRSHSDLSGIVCNGSYYIMEGHLSYAYYGISDSRNANKPVGVYKHKSDEIGNPIPLKDETLDNTFTFTDLNLGFIKETLGYLTSDDKNIVKIISHDDIGLFAGAKSSTSNILTGNLLVYTGDIVMKEELIGKVITKVPYPLRTPNTEAYLCDSVGKLLTYDEIASLVLGGSCHIKFADGGVIRTTFTSYNILTPYLFKTFSSGAGEVPPAMPAHASDLNPRTCILIDENENVIIMKIEGRQAYGAQGIDLFDLAKVCKAMGAKYALNLDGGGSSKMAWKEKSNDLVRYAGQDGRYLISNSIAFVEK
jgi:hypothetical protein